MNDRAREVETMTDTLEVTQEDEAAASEIIRVVVNLIRSGKPVCGEVEAVLARHRIAAITAARPLILEEAAGIAEAHKEVQPRDDMWWRGWNAACGHLAELFRELDAAPPTATAIRAAGERP